MIKAETIIHEGSAGPNWLDHCRAVLQPQILLGIVVVVLAVSTFIVAKNRDHTNVDNVQSTDSSQQAAGATSLRVAPLSSLTTGQSATDTGSASTTPATSGLQPANNAGDAALPGTVTTTTNAANGAPAASVTPNVGPAPTTSSQSLQSVGGSLQQSTVQTTQTVLNSVVNLPKGL